MYVWGNFNFQVAAPPLGGQCVLKFPTRAPTSIRTNKPLDGGQLADFDAKVEPSFGQSVTSLACGYNFTLMICNKTLYGFGSNHHHQLGTGVATYVSSLRAIPFRARSAPVEVACGRRHTIVRTADGMVYTAGDNTLGQLGRSLGKQVTMVDFAEVSLAGITQIAAADHASFALTDRGALYSWGSAEHGHLGHGDRGEGRDELGDDDKTRVVNVDRPKQVRWFVDKRVKLVQIAVGKGHIAVRSETDVYTVGEGFYGKLGNGDSDFGLVPYRVTFPQRKTTEKLISIAAGNNHTLVLKHSGEVGSVLYHFGQSNGDQGSLTPSVVETPINNFTSIFAGLNTAMGAITDDGKLFVWGNYAPLSNGAPKRVDRGSSKVTPTQVTALEDFFVTQYCCTGNTLVAIADDNKARSTRTQATQSTKPRATKNGIELIDLDEEEDNNVTTEDEQAAHVGASKDAPCSLVEDVVPMNYHQAFDTIIPLADRVGAQFVSDTFDEARIGFYSRWLGEGAGATYYSGVPQPQDVVVQQKHVARKGAHGLQVGDKVRLWMTDVYALATVAERPIAAVHPPTPVSSQQTPLPDTSSSSTIPTQSLLPPSSTPIKHDHTEADIDGGAYTTGSCMVYLEWIRDDWVPEDIELYSEDETLDEQNPNRWQSVWFVEAPTTGETV
jgi:alpha-tubulin suppressor-like RCC1 family protein